MPIIPNEPTKNVQMLQAETEISTNDQSTEQVVRILCSVSLLKPLQGQPAVLDSRGKASQKILFGYPAPSIRLDNQIATKLSLFFRHGLGTKLKFRMLL